MAFDAIVIGLGGMGSAASYHLARRGLRVLGLEQFTSPHDRGSSHGDSRIIRQAYHEDPAYVPLVQRAYELWEQLERDSGRSLLQITGGLMIGYPGSPVVEGTIRSAVEHGLPYEVLTSREIAQRFPALRPRHDETAVFELRAGFVRPEEAVRAHLDLAARAGAELHFQEPVERWSIHGDRVEVETTRGLYEAGRLVLAPGAWAPQVLEPLGLPLEVRRHVMCWFEPEPGQGGAFLPDRFPIYIWDVDGKDIFYGFPGTGSPLEGVKAAMHSGGDPCTPAELKRDLYPAEMEVLRRQIERFIPALNGRVLKAVPCMYTLTPDEHFILAGYPGATHVAVAAGFSGHGFKFTPVIGEVLADLATSGRTTHPIALFDPARLAASESASMPVVHRHA